MVLALDIAVVPAFWHVAPQGTPFGQFAPTRTVHDGQGHIYALGFAPTPDIANATAAGSLVRLDETTGAIDLAFRYDERLGSPLFLAIQPDGKLLVAVEIGLSEGTAVVRINSDGSQDISFHGPLFDRSIRFLTLQADGKLLVTVQDDQDFYNNDLLAGAVVTGRNGLYRLNSDGTVDSGFSPTALNFVSSLGNSGTLFGPPTLDSNGRIYLAGNFSFVNGIARKFIARLTPTGAVDLSFADPTNAALLPANFGGGFGRSAVIQSTGKIVFVGSFTYSGRSLDPVMAIRFNADGTFDNTFAQPTKSQLALNGGVRLQHAVLLPNDQILAVSGRLLRLNADGSLDTNFAAQNLDVVGNWLSRSPTTGNIYVPALTNPALGGIACFLPDGTSVLSFNTGGWGFTAGPSSAIGMKDGRVLAGGKFNRYGAHSPSGLALFSPTGISANTATSFFNPDTGSIEPTGQVAAWQDGSFVVKVSDTGVPVTGVGQAETIRRFHADGTEDANWHFTDTASFGARISAAEPNKLYVWYPVLTDSTLFQPRASNWLRRFNADGSIDPSFAPDFSSMIRIRRDDGGNISDIEMAQIFEVRSLLDGSVLMLTADINQQMRVVKLRANGALDSTYHGVSFGLGGVTSLPTQTMIDPVTGRSDTYPIITTEFPVFHDMLALPDGTAYFTGKFRVAGQPAGLVRLLADGTMDHSFVGAGLAYSGAQPLPAVGTALGLDDFGRVYVAGRFDHANGGAAPGLARFTAAGILDVTFAPSVEVRADRLPKTVVLGAHGRLHILGAAAIPGAPVASGYESMPLDATAPVILSQSSSQSLHSGQALTLFAGAFAGPDATYQWFKNSSAIDGATNRTLDLPTLAAGDTGVYRLTVTNGLGAQSSADIVLTVSDAPAIISQPVAATTVDAGGTATLRASAVGSAPLSFEWRKNSAPISGATQASFTIASAQVVDSGSYTVNVSNAAGSVESTAAILTVLPIPTILVQPVGQNVVSGYATNLSVTTNGVGNTFQWFKDGVPLGSASASPTLVAATAARPITSPTVFHVVVTSTTGPTTTSAPAILTPVSPYAITTIAGASNQVGTVDGAGPTARFTGPQGIAMDAGGNLFVADNNVIRKISKTGFVSTFAGSGASASVDGLGTAASFNGLSGLAIDSLDNLFATESTSGAIRKITPDGTVSTVVGATSGVGTAGGSANPRILSRPEGIAYDASQNIFYFADSGSQTIRKLTPAGEVSIFAGVPFVAGSDDGAGAAARFFSPSGVAVDPAGNVYVTDSANQFLKKITPSGDVTSFAGVSHFPNSLFGSNDGHGSSAKLDAPGAIAYEPISGGVLIMDAGILRCVSRSGEITSLAGSSRSSSSVDGVGTGARFSQPLNTYSSGILVDVAGIVYISDTMNATIRRGVSAALIQLAITTQPASQTVTAGSNVNFTVAADNAASFAWFKDNIALGVTTPTLSLSSVTTANSGSYTVVVTNVTGSVTSNPATLTVLTGFAAYQAAHFTSVELADPLKSGHNAVFGVDGFTNLVKYALGLDPKQDAVTGVPTFAKVGADWVYTYTRPSSTTDVAYAVEVSTDLVTFTTTGVILEQVSVSNGVETWRGRFPATSAPKLFARLRVNLLAAP